MVGTNMTNDGLNLLEWLNAVAPQSSGFQCEAAWEYLSVNGAVIGVECEHDATVSLFEGGRSGLLNHRYLCDVHFRDWVRDPKNEGTWDRL